MRLLLYTLLYYHDLYQLHYIIHNIAIYINNSMVALKYFVSREPINLYIPHEYWMSDELFRSNRTSSSIHVGRLELTSPHHY